MVSIRQLEANRCNARRSTGPKTASGKMRSRSNALKHGLTAVTVVGVFERNEDYDVFEQAILADYMPNSFVQHELVLRLASLFWRLRRAAAVETGLIQIHGELQRAGQDQHAESSSEPEYRAEAANGSIIRLDQAAPREPVTTPPDDLIPVVDIARCFLRLAIYDRGLFERIGRYEKALWRQARQLIAMLDRVRKDAVVL